MSVTTLAAVATKVQMIMPYIPVNMLLPLEIINCSISFLPSLQDGLLKTILVEKIFSFIK
jgi:hypothetical protein